ncbi:unnamed protein product [Rotaria sp. Silwood2]|nr:unnamed protein product [Rotaria sp. Silwood2]
MDWVVYDTGSPIADTDSRMRCVYFRPRETGDKTFLTIQYGQGCNAHHYAFDKGVWGTTAVNLGTTYDYSSIMHYGADYFSSNGRPTIVPKQVNAPIGSRDKLSPTDIVEVRKFYGCVA